MKQYNGHLRGKTRKKERKGKMEKREGRERERKEEEYKISHGYFL